MIGIKRKSIRTFFSVAVLSCLIWFYADQVTTDFTTEMIKVSIKPMQDASIIIRSIEPSDGTVEVTFAGPRAQLERLKSDIRAGKFNPVYYLQVEDKGPDEEYLLSVEDIVSDYLVRQHKAVTVKSATPSQIRIKVDTIIAVKMPVKVITGAIEVSEVSIVPDTLTVRLPRTFYTTLADSQRFIPVDIGHKIADKLEQEEFSMDVEVPQKLLGQAVEVEPSRVRIRLKIEHHYVRREFKRPIYILWPVGMENKYTVELRDKDVNVPIICPKNRVDTLKPEKIIPYIELTEEDVVNLPETFFPRRLSFILPEGVKIDTSKMTVIPETEFRVKRIKREVGQGK